MERTARVMRLLAERPVQAELLREAVRRAVPPSAKAAARGLASISPRPALLWQFAVLALERTTLSSVEPALRAELLETKLLASIYFTAVDDVADRLRCRALLRAVAAELQRALDEPGGAAEPGAVEAREPHVDPRAAALSSLWREVVRRARSLPRFFDFADCLAFDAPTIVHGMSHALLAARCPEALGEEEQRLWNVHAFYLMVFADLDLMASPRFRLTELSPLRAVVGAAQEMCAVANWLGTWEREVRGGDFTSGWTAMATRRGLLTTGTIRRSGAAGDHGMPDIVAGADEPDAIIRRIRGSDIEAALLARWEDRRRELEARLGEVDGVDVGAYLRGLEDYFLLQMAARGKL